MRTFSNYKEDLRIEQLRGCVSSLWCPLSYSIRWGISKSSIVIHRVRTWTSSNASLPGIRGIPRRYCLIGWLTALSKPWLLRPESYDHFLPCWGTATLSDHWSVRSHLLRKERKFLSYIVLVSIAYFEYLNRLSESSKRLKISQTISIAFSKPPPKDGMLNLKANKGVEWYCEDVFVRIYADQPSSLVLS